MFFDDHKKKITSILSRRNEKGEQIMGPVEVKPEMSHTEGGEIDGRHVAAQDLIAAFDERSPQKLMEALANFMDIHSSQPQSVAEDE